MLHFLDRFDGGMIIGVLSDGMLNPDINVV